MEHLLNLLAPADATNTILWSPYLPDYLLWMGLFLVLILCVYSLFNRIKGSLLRLTIGLFLLIALANPVWVEKQKEAQSDIALILIDDSPSQRISDRPAQIENARHHILEELGQAGKELEIKTLKLSELLGKDTLQAESLIVKALNRALSDIPTNRHAGSILITDGQSHDTNEEIAALTVQDQFKGKPFHIFYTGSKDEIDRRITLVEVPSYGLVDEEATITFRIDQDGDIQEQQALVTIRADGQRPQRMNLPVGQSQHSARTSWSFKYCVTGRRIT